VSSLTSLLDYQQDVLKRVRELLRSRPPDLRGGLIWLKTGAGKTAIAAGILVWYLMYENLPLTESRSVVVLSSQSNKQINNPQIYLNEIARHYAPHIPHAGGITEAHFRVWSYEQAYNALFDRSIEAHKEFRSKIQNKNGRITFIIDEIHDLSKDSLDKDTSAVGKKERRVRDFLLNEAPSKTTLSGVPMFDVYGMTATPGDSVDEMARTLTMVGPHVERGFWKTHLAQGGSMNNRLVRKMMKDIIIWKSPFEMRTRNGKSIFPSEKHKRCETTMHIDLYILMMMTLGRAALTTEYATGNYRHRSQRDPRSPNGKLIKAHSEQQKRNGNTNIPSLADNKIKKVTLFTKKYIQPRSDWWLQPIEQMQLYLTDEDFRNLIPDKATRDRYISTFGPNGPFQIVEWKNPKKNSETGADATTISRRYVPTNGKIMNVVRNITKIRSGRQLVYTKSAEAAKIIAKLLEKGKNFSAGQPQYKNISNVDKHTGVTKDATTVDMMFKIRETNGKPSARALEGNPEAVNYLITRYRDVSREFRANKPIRKFFLATNDKQVKIAKTIMQKDNTLESFIDVVRRKVQRRNMTNENLRRRLMNINNRQYLVPRNGEELLYDMEHYNLDGRYMQILIIGGGHLYQGLDIKALKALHIVDVMHTPRQYQQILGRASRGFGHHELPPTERHVSIYQYTSAIPNTNSITRNSSGMNLLKSPSHEANVALYSRIQQLIAARFDIKEVVKKKVNRKLVDLIQGMALHTIAGMRFIQHHKKSISDTTQSLGVNQLLASHREKTPSFRKIENVKTKLKMASLQMYGMSVGKPTPHQRATRQRTSRTQSKMTHILRVRSSGTRKRRG